MAVRPASVARPAPVAGRPFALGRAVEREGVFSWLMLVPGILFLLAFVAYPFFYGIFLSLQERRVASAGTFVGLANFAALAQDPVFWQVTRNTFVYTILATLVKMVGGLDGSRHQPAVPRSEPRPGVPPPALYRAHRALHGGVDVDPRSDVQRDQLVAAAQRPGEGELLVAGQQDAGHGLHHRCQHVARAALLRHHAAGRTADDLARSVRGGRHRRRERHAALP